MARTYKDSDPWRAGTGQTNPYETVVGGLVNQAMGTAPQHRWHNTGHTYLHKAAWGWHSALLLGQTLGSVMAFLFLAWMWSHQFDNVILPHPCGFCPTALNCFPLPQRPTDASRLLYPLTRLWAFILPSFLSSSLHLFCYHARIQEPQTD